MDIPPQQSVTQQPLLTGQQPARSFTDKKSFKSKKDSSPIDYKYIIIGIVTVAVVILIYNYLSERPESASSASSEASASSALEPNFSTSVPLEPIFSTSVPLEPIFSTSVPLEPNFSTCDLDIINRLNSLEL